MEDPESELDSALTDVRRAWRLVYAYQRRVNDLLALIDTGLGAQKFTFGGWRPTFFSPPPRTGTPFFRTGTWAWDMLPGYRLYAEWSRWEAAPGLTRRVTVEVCADSGFKKAGGEPDPADFDPVENGKTMLWVGLWTAASKTPDWGAGWAAVSAKPIPMDTEVTATVAGIVYKLRSVPVDIKDLPEPKDVQNKVIQPIVVWASGVVPPAPPRP